MVNGVHHRTFQEAAIAIGLFKDRSEAMQCIEEAIAMGTLLNAMQFLFVQILLNLPCSAATLFERYKESFCEDFIDQGLNDRMILNHVLHHLSALLQLSGFILEDFKLPEPTESQFTK